MSRKKKCTHHWMLESPNGPESPGTCKHCGTTKSFPNAQSPEELIKGSGFDKGGVRYFTLDTDHEPTDQFVERITS